MKARLMLLACVGSIVAARSAVAAGPQSESPSVRPGESAVRSLSAIGNDVQAAMRAEALSRRLGPNVADVLRLVDLYRELAAHPKRDESAVAKELGLTLRSRLKDVSERIERRGGAERAANKSVQRGASFYSRPVLLTNVQGEGGERTGGASGTQVGKSTGGASGTQVGRSTGGASGTQIGTGTGGASGTQKVPAVVAPETQVLAQQVAGGGAGGPGPQRVAGPFVQPAAAQAGVGPPAQVVDYGPQLVDLIQRTISPASWDINGGNSSIVYFAPLRVLVVSAPEPLHEQIGGVLGR